ncbi:hypothetical protein H7X46_00100 [Pseudonocardia sp. C8]|uniref:hypothetical protein n=1 Tax=Pseudonocardia sp. C8 TaxID=2762759 RepID=UPI0016434459|nr:hypothetical protein [Pseudonocardia sp. C8]MBC3189471.1 hypothetical protein [Pseudonocardia sp. C8]
MTTLADLRRIFAVRGIDPDRITQPPAPGEASFLFTTALGGQVWFAPTEQDGRRTGWAYSGWNRHGELTEAGHTDTTAPEGLLPVLHRHQNLRTAPASLRQRDTLLALATPDEHTPWEMRTSGAADRWILGLFVAWTRLQDGDGGICGSDLIEHVGRAFEAIGLTDVEFDDEIEAPHDELLDELAARVDPGPDPAGDDPTLPVLTSHLEQALDKALDEALVLGRQLGVLTLGGLAAEMAAGLRRSGLLAPAAGAVTA